MSAGTRSGRELDAPELDAERLSQGVDGQGLGQAGHPFDQEVAPGEQDDHHPLQQAVLADDDPLHLVEDLLERGRGLVRGPAGCAHLLGAPAAPPAVAIGTAKLMPEKSSTPAGLAIPVTIPTTWPWLLTSGPPEFPGFTAASNWISPVRVRPVPTLNVRSRPETTPAVRLSTRPSGWPTAKTSVADLNAAAEHRRYRHGRRVLGRKRGDVVSRIRRLDRRRRRGAVGERHLDGRGALDHMQGGEDLTLVAHHHSGADRLAGGRARGAGLDHHHGRSDLVVDDDARRRLRLETC